MNGNSGGRLGPLVYLANNWISLLGVAFVTTAGVAWLFTLPLQLGSAGAENPYLGILTVFGLPALFFLGLVLIPIGIRLKERRERNSGVYPKSFPPLTWANPEFRKLSSFVLIMTAVNVVIGGQLTYSAVEYMETKSFCGQSCHIMEPEWTAYQFAPHAEVACVDCHIGEGAESFVAAKLNGTMQLIEVIFDSYPRPVPTPVHNLAQGKLTCAECHSDRDLGDKRKEWIFFAEDELNSATRTELLLKIGGGDNHAGAHGAHMANGAVLEYRSDPKRETIPWMRYTAPDGRETVYATADWSDAKAGELELRTMDCTDCHNRAAHSFENASKAIDRAMAEGKIDASLPFIKREGMAAVKAQYKSREEAASGIASAIEAFYQQRQAPAAAVDSSAKALVAIYERNVWPEFGVTWGVHPNQAGHEDFPGCFRCHDDGHVSQDAAREAIGDTCESCHAILVDGQPVSAPSAAPAMTLTSARGNLPQGMTFQTKAGTAEFDHAKHVEYEKGECVKCHNALFPMARTDLHYGADLHRAAEAAKTSCAGCHVAGGEAFASANNCQKCHTGLSAPRAVMAGVRSNAPNPLPGEVRFKTDLGEALFDHAKHVEHSKGRCVDCHNALFPMEKDVDLAGYGRDMHRSAEAAKSSCAGCHVTGGEAFASAGNCAKCHVGLGEPKRTPVTGISGIPDVPSVETRLGPARFDHEKHIELAKDNCQACHNKIFPLEKGLLGYEDNLHKTAEAAKTSCGACHFPGGEAFGSKGNCLKCHTDASTSERGSLLGLPERIFYQNRLGDVSFDHDQHIADEKGNCKTCHDGLWPMAEVGLKGYSEDYHRVAEKNNQSCAVCHAPHKESFGSLNNCTRCHEGLELDVAPDGRKASLFSSMPWAMLLLLSIPAGAGAQTKGGYIGSEKCKVCHEEQMHGFDNDPHMVLATSQRFEDKELLCESCHGPGLPHVEALDPSRLAVWADGQPSRVNQSCLECHAGEGGQAGRFFSDHMRNGLACTSCHQMHDAPERKLLAKSTDALCASCHADVNAAFNRPFKHKLHEGAMSCTDCHNPHGEPPPAMVTRVSANELVCLKCHGDKRGPFPFEHAPVKVEPCTTCHEPHGSSNPRMMARHNVGQLCLECHTTTTGTLGGTPPAFHDMRSPRFRNCTTCHSKIHGSFVSRDFLR
ncbi:MAG: DmsE family decaheme c-type cytochrome [Bryobacterales bacterium]|nr:DmsE family decaheme c-type cytochrome [Bryobacterales bacterium]